MAENRPLTADYAPYIGTAASLADAAHRGQTDKAGAPYIGHPARVAAIVQARHPGNHLAVMVAWLHDVVEDTPVTLEHIEAWFGPEVSAAVDALTHRPHEARADYYARVRTNPVAALVKDADLDDNTDPARLALLDAPTRARLEAKYAQARAALTLS